MLYWDLLLLLPLGLILETGGGRGGRGAVEVWGRGGLGPPAFPSICSSDGGEPLWTPSPSWRTQKEISGTSVVSGVCLALSAPFCFEINNGPRRPPGGPRPDA